MTYALHCDRCKTRADKGPLPWVKLAWSWPDKDQIKLYLICDECANKVDMLLKGEVEVCAGRSRHEQNDACDTA